MNTWKVILATLVIFVAGVITGGLLVTYSNRVLQPGRETARTHRPTRATRTLEVPRLAPPLRRDFLNRLDRQLRLTPRQRKRIEKIIHQGQERTGQLWKTIAPEVRAELALTRERIRAELTPPQQRRFQQLMRRLHVQHRPSPARNHSRTNTPAPRRTNGVRSENHSPGVKRTLTPSD